MDEVYGGTDNWQAFAITQWIEQLSKNSELICILDGQARPSFIRTALLKHTEIKTDIVLLDCQPEVRRERLIKYRKQPELASAQMNCWAAYLKGQADALGLPVIDTSNQTVEKVADQLLYLAQAINKN